MLSASTCSPPEGYGEIIGGSQCVDSYDLRKCGSVPTTASAWESNE